MLSRRRFLAGLFVAPAIIKTAGLVMPIKSVPPFVCFDVNGNSFYPYTTSLWKWNKETKAVEWYVTQHIDAILYGVPGANLPGLSPLWERIV